MSTDYVDRMHCSPKLVRMVVLACWLVSGGWTWYGDGGTVTADESGANAVSPPDNRLAERDRLWAETQALEAKGLHEQAIQLAQRVLAIEVEIFGEKHFELSGTLNLIARQYATLDQFDAALNTLARRSALLAELPNLPSWQVKDGQRDLDNLRLLSQLTDEDRAEVRRAAVLSEQSSALASGQSIAEAVQLAREVLAIRERVLGGEHLDTAVALHDLAFVLEEQGDSASALVFYAKALAIRRRVLGDDHPTTALSLNNLGYSANENGDLANARRYYEEALAIRRRTLGNDHASTVNTLINLATLLKDSGDYKSARQCFDEILAIRQKVLGDKHLDTAAAWNYLGVLSRSTGDYSAARYQYEQALAIQRTALGEDHPVTAQTMNNLSVNLKDQGDLVEATVMQEKALAIRRKTLGDEHRDTLESLGNLGVVFSKRAQFGRARECFEQVLATELKVLGPDHRGLAESLNRLAYLFEVTRDFPEAKRLYERALSIQRGRLGNSHPETAQTLDYLGGLLALMDKKMEAVARYEEAIAIRRTVLGEDHPDTIASLNNLAVLLMNGGDYIKSKAYFEQALAIQRKRSGTEQLTAALLDNLAKLHMAVGEYSQARDCFDESLAIRERLYGMNHLATADSLNNLAILRHALKEYDESRLLYTQSLEICRHVLGNSHPETFLRMYNLGLLLAASGKNDEAVQIFLEANQREEQFLSHELFAFSEAKLNAYVSRFAGRLDVLASLPVVQLHRERELAETLLTRKAVVLEILQRRRHAEQLAAADPEIGKLRNQLSAARDELENLLLRPARDALQEELDTRRETLRQQCKDLEDQYARTLGRAAKSDAQLAVSVDDLRKRLTAGQYLIEYLRFTRREFQSVEQVTRWQEDRYAACVIGADENSSVRVIDLGPAAEIDQLVGDLTAQVREFQSERESADESSYEDDYRKIASKLYAKIMAPLQEAIAGATQIYVGPDSRLHEIPFEALVDTNGKYLIEAGYQFAYVSSGRDLVRPQSAEPGSGVLVFAGPNYDLDASGRLAAARHATEAHAESAVLATTGRPTLPAAINESPALRSTDSRAGWRYLPGADLEGQEAGSAFTQAGWDRVQIFTGNEAQEDLVKRVHRPRVLVLVTHGDFLDDAPAADTSSTDDRSFGLVSSDAADVAAGPTSEDRGRTMQARSGLRTIDNPLLRSYLLLAGANKIDERLPEGTQIENGWLTAQEIGDLDLQGTDLVVLSACNTNRGQAANGQAVVGMRSAFLFAGAKTIVGSLYEVPNAETRLLLRPFYAGVAGGAGKLASLHSAKLEFLRQRRASVGAAHPFYWASFVLVGAP